MTAPGGQPQDDAPREQYPASDVGKDADETQPGETAEMREQQAAGAGEGPTGTT